MTRESRPEYATAGSHTEFNRWVREDPRNRTRVTKLNTAERAQGRASGVLHWVGMWKRSEAREAAERLEG